ncbi:hypothetical protein GS504_00865 [Rhodococcus hoagii]|nr:hypothetical protein [Prescottella equi]
MKTTLKIAATAAGACAALALGAGTASAITVQPVPGGTQIELNHGETVALANAHIAAPVVDALMPVRLQHEGENLSFGAGVQRRLDLAARTPGAWAGATVFGPLHAPHQVDLYHHVRN